MRPRELWLWLGGALLTLGSLLAAIALTYFAKQANFSLYTSWQMLSAVVAFVLAFACFLAAVLGRRFPTRRPYFPDIKITVDAVGTERVSHTPMPDLDPSFKIPTTLHSLRVQFTNDEVERGMTIKAVRLFLKVAQDGSWPFSEALFVQPSWQIPGPPNIQPLQFPLNIDPQTSVGGHLVFEISDHWGARLASATGRLEIEDAHTNNLVTCPATLGTFNKKHGLRPTTRAEWVSDTSSA